jgi:ATP-dependent Clp protease ATP-binding subunit ClpA
MYILDVSAIGRQFPDKAIDLIDEACAATIKRVMRINKQAQEVNAKQSRSANSVKGATVVPNDVAQVGIFLYCVNQ